MKRKLLLRITVPSVLFGVVLFAACLLSIRYIHRLQSNLADILTDNVNSLQAVQELEIQVRQLRFHTVFYLSRPQPELLQRIEDDQTKFEKRSTPCGRRCAPRRNGTFLRTIEKTYEQYKSEHEQLIARAQGRPLPDVYKIEDEHPVRLVVEPCEKLLKINEEKIAKSAADSERLSREAYAAMLFLGLAGPFGGLVIGYGVTRGLRRSIYQLSVRVQDLAHHLDQDVGSVSVTADGDLRIARAQDAVHRAESRGGGQADSAAAARTVANRAAFASRPAGGGGRPRNPQSAHRHQDARRGRPAGSRRRSR